MNLLPGWHELRFHKLSNEAIHEYDIEQGACGEVTHHIGDFVLDKLVTSESSLCVSDHRFTSIDYEEDSLSASLETEDANLGHADTKCSTRTTEQGSAAAAEATHSITHREGLLHIG